jgi:hypothetical protein
MIVKYYSMEVLFMIFNLKDNDLNNYVTWVYNSLLAKFTGYENNGQLGSPKIVEVAGEDINNYITAGIYCFAVNYSPINKPSGNTNGWLIVIPWQASGGTCKQIWLRHGTLGDTDHSIYIRTRISGEWGEWYEVFTDRSQGVYNLGAPIGKVAENSNLDDYKTVGTYTATGTGIAGTITNAPTTLNFKLVVENINSINYILQTVISRLGKKWTRYYDKSSNTWGDWETNTLNEIKEISMNNNGELLVTRADGVIATFKPDTLL